MITLSEFTYTPAQWDAIKRIVRDRLGVDADTVWPLRDSIEIAASMYHFRNDSTRQRPRRDDLKRLREDAENMQARIIDVVGVRIAVRITAEEKENNRAPSLLSRDWTGFGMLAATDNYFIKLLRDLDSLIAQAGPPPSQNARKIARDQCREELLTIWCDIGGTAHGTAAADFLKATSGPVMPDEARSLPTIMQWLERRRRKNAKQKTEPLPRRAIG